MSCEFFAVEGCKNLVHSVQLKRSARSQEAPEVDLTIDMDLFAPAMRSQSLRISFVLKTMI